jgi:hypothetical protein
MSQISPNDGLHHFVVSYIHTIWGSKEFFPGPQPISIEYKHFGFLKNDDYVVCEKTDGMRYMLVCLMYGGKKKSILVNRNFDMIDVSVNFRRPAYNGTILDGELYEDTLLVYDAIIINNEKIGELDFLDRLSHMEKLIKTVVTMKNDKLKLKLKKFHVMDDFAIFMDKHLPKVKENVDGVVFTPVNCPIKIGTHETMFKWKPQEKNTVDFLMKRGRSFVGVGVQGPPVWQLFVQERGKLVFESEIPYGHMEDKPWFEDGAIVECMYITWEKGPLWWKPLKRRYDKTYPNNRRTFYRTLVNIRENIQLKEFLDCRPGYNGPLA